MKLPIQSIGYFHYNLQNTSSPIYRILPVQSTRYFLEAGEWGTMAPFRNPTFHSSPSEYRRLVRCNKHIGCKDPPNNPFGSRPHTTSPYRPEHCLCICKSCSHRWRILLLPRDRRLRRPGPATPTPPRRSEWNSFFQ